MEILIFRQEAMETFMKKINKKFIEEAFKAAEENPILIDKFVVMQWKLM